MADGEVLLSAKQLAKLLGVSLKWVYANSQDEGILKTIRVGRLKRFDKNEVLKNLKEM
ncbi:MAG: helix-turn-helix domain-containing protein [Bacteriovoracaceae bacterium]